MFVAIPLLYLSLFVHGCFSELTRDDVRDVLIEAVQNCEVYCKSLRRRSDPCLTDLECGDCQTLYDAKARECAHPHNTRQLIDNNVNDQEAQIDRLSLSRRGEDEPETTTTKKPSTTKKADDPKHSKQSASGGSQAASHSAAVGIGAVGNIAFIAIVAGCSVAGMVGVVVAGVCWYRFQKDVKAASEVEYPAYGVTGPNKERIQSPGDRKLAQSAQMYHYQHQKQQMIALEKANGEMRHDASDEDSEEENEEGDYTVYECPGLAPTGEMEVKNPLFNEDSNNSAPPSGPADPVTTAADQSGK